MKILIVNSLYHPHIVGGAETSTQLIAEGLKSNGHEPVIVTTSKKYKVDYVNRIKVYYLKIPNLYWLIDAKKQPIFKKLIWHLVDAYNPFIKASFSKVIASERPVIIHTNNLTGFSVMVWRIANKYNLPLIHTTRDHSLLCPRTSMFKNNQNCIHQCLDCKLLSIFRKHLSTNVDAVVGVSKYILNKHLQLGYFSSSKIKTYINNSVNSTLNPLQTKRNNSKITFGYIGLLSPGKGIEYLLKRFSEMDLKNASLLIFGKGITSEYEEEIKNRYENENIMFRGFKKAEEIYPHLDIVLVPSLLEEPFSRILLEVLPFGIPVIASNRGGSPEIVKEGVTGFTYDPDKKGDLENKVELFISNRELLTKMSRNCLITAEEYSIDKVVGKYNNIYQRLIK